MAVRRFPSTILFGATLFLAAILSFLVQPMIAKAALPYFGGSPAVWTVCMLFFQTGLLLGYTYAHYLSRIFTLKHHIIIHLLVILMMLLTRGNFTGLLERVDSPGLRDSPTLTLIAFLVRKVGLTYFVLATTAPLLQRWYVAAGGPGSDDPYFLYAASNAGSLAALAGYPLWVERHYRLAEQSGLWGRGLLLLSVLMVFCGVWAVSRSVKRPPVSGSKWPSSFRPSFLDLLTWVTLAFIPSCLLLGVTTYLTTDLAAIPLLWAVPLGLYLTTFIVVFSRFLDRAERIGRRALPILVMIQAPVMAAGLVQPFWIPLHLLSFTAAALVCHGALAKRRPEAERLTTFFLAMAMGGALGGVFNAILAPCLFNRLTEYPLAVVWACLALAVRSDGMPDEDLSWRTLIYPTLIGGTALTLFANAQGINETGFGVIGTMIAAGLSALVAWTHRSAPVRFALTVASLLAASGFGTGIKGPVIFQERSFFGILTVTQIDFEGEPIHRLFHGSTLHGQQNFLPEKRGEPQTYFDRAGPVGQIFQVFDAKARSGDAQVAVTGVGAGSLAAYGKIGQSWTFFEIDPAVDRVARDPRFFTYIQDSAASDVETVMGDARLTMAREKNGTFDLIVLDAFSSDAIPAHLLTREALQLYRAKLAPGGLIAVNITNRYLDLAPVVAALALDAGWEIRFRRDSGHSRAERERGITGSIWALLASRTIELGKIIDDPRWSRPLPRPGVPIWTDDFTNLFDHLRF